MLLGSFAQFVLGSEPRGFMGSDDRALFHAIENAREGEGQDAALDLFNALLEQQKEDDDEGLHGAGAGAPVRFAVHERPLPKDLEMCCSEETQRLIKEMRRARQEQEIVSRARAVAAPKKEDSVRLAAGYKREDIE